MFTSTNQPLIKGRKAAKLLEHQTLKEFIGQTLNRSRVRAVIRSLEEVAHAPEHKMRPAAAKILLDWYKLGLEYEEAVKRAETAEADVARMRAHLERLGYQPVVRAREPDGATQQRSA